MILRLLGNVEVEVGQLTFGFDRAAERCVLATLAFNPGRPVHVDTLVDNVWAEQRPAKAEQTIATYVRAVRRTIEQAGGQRDWLRSRRPRSYELRIDPAIVDYHRFAVLATAARASVRQGDHGEAAETFEEALRLWRGDPLANISSEWAERRRYALQRERLDVLCALLDLQLQIGEYAAVATQAQQLVHDHPTDRVLALAMRGLAYGGDHAMVPALVSRATERMWETAGVRPGADIAALARELTSGAGEMATRVVLRPPPAPADPQSAAEPADATGSPGSAVSMTATHNGRVWQAARDQFITER